MSIFRPKIDITHQYVYSFDMSSTTFDPNRPFNELPPLPPAQVVETVPVLKAIIAAKEKLAELRTACQLIPNPEILTSTIPLREARASTEIENIVTTNDELFRAAWNVDAEPTPATKEALRYNAALHAGLESIGQRPLSAKTTQIVCGTLQSDEPHIAPFRSYPGTFIGNPHTQQRIYTPPEGREVIEQHLSRWERYIYSEYDVDSLVKMALLHYQFEAIHPFTDGNGRTGRILNVLYLLQEALLLFPVLYLSGYIVENKAQYYRCLNRVTTESAWEDWLLFMIRGVEVAATDASTMIADLRQVQDEITAVIRDAGIISPAKEMSEITMVRPYLRIQDVEDSGLVKRQTAATWLNHLVDIGVLSETKRGRQRIFINDAALRVLTRE
ncbi:Fic family protein [Corynebacterium diphtheriae bv. mitis]|uniref:Fic family protein n=1 Tax=Corynebacterium diphtheriae TaxID=1717 RepID=UPI0013C7900E|nr:Fic/DOC family N-terminal domain-containing protein [Corynebacterium diphtheriae]MBG9274233.1 Fic family protein [Corynebacterium diphtheriae bv. mitis]CAB0488820.1 Fic family protein [Corynebacterium diphtheriae]CAB0533910.1 Fic family protein [Corynebacterium diphtheriae]